MSQLAHVEFESHERVRVAVVTGEIDLSNADSLGDQLASAVPNWMESLIVDLSSTTHLDSAGLRLLFGLKSDLEARGQSLLLVVPNDALTKQVISITGLEDAVPVHPTLEEALRQPR